MTQEKAGELDAEILGIFSKSFAKRYDGWKRKDLLLIALQSLPKQIETEDLIDHLAKLKSEFEKKLSNEEQNDNSSP